MNILIFLLILMIILFLLLLFLISPRLSRRTQMERFFHTRFAHRGYYCSEKHIPANAMPAFSAAIKHGIGIELDLHLTRDGEVVVFHNDTLKEVCGDDRPIEALSFAELKSHLLEGTTETIPLFSDVLRLVDGKVPLLVELKLPTGKVAPLCEKVTALMKDYPGPYLIQSFNTLGLFWYRHHAPDILRGQLSRRLTITHTPQPWILKFLTENMMTNFLGRPDFISYRMDELPNPFVTLLTKLYHTPLAVWTVKTPEEMKIASEKYEMLIFEESVENYEI